MNDPAERLRAVLSETVPQLKLASEEDGGRDRGDGKWVRKEILGHLIDSALNNHQRFVRVQVVDRLIWPGYDGDAWVVIHRYKERRWSDLVELWSTVNYHLAHLISSVAPEHLAKQCVIGSGNSVTLEWLMGDYVEHLCHHVDQILDREVK
jgi:hypothetical protein